MRNHKYFLIFLIGYVFYLITVMIEIFRHAYELAYGSMEIDSIIWLSIILLLILLNVPVLVFQLRAQVYSLLKKPKLNKNEYQRLEDS